MQIDTSEKGWRKKTRSRKPLNQIKFLICTISALNKSLYLNGIGSFSQNFFFVSQLWRQSENKKPKLLNDSTLKKFQQFRIKA